MALKPERVAADNRVMKTSIFGIRLSYANVVSTLCLFLLLGGGAAFAATQLPKNSVGAKQIKKGAVTPAKIAQATRKQLSGAPGPAGPQGSPGAPGERGEPGTPATKLFAQIRANGAVNVSGSPITVLRKETGQYLVNFGREISRCSAVVNQGSVPLFDVPGSATAAAVGYAANITILSPGPGKEYAPGFPVATTIGVSTYSGAAPNDTSFFITVVC